MEGSQESCNHFQTAEEHVDDLKILLLRRGVIALLSLRAQRLISISYPLSMFIEGLKLRSFEGKNAIYDQPQEEDTVGIDLEMP